MEKRKIKIIVIASLSIIALSYGVYLFKKSFIDKGFDKDKEKESYLMLYIIALGLEFNDENIKKYQNLSIEEIKKRLKEMEKNVEPTDDDFFPSEEQ
jgi:hypothetical protein